MVQKKDVVHSKKFFINIMRQIVERVDSMEETVRKSERGIPYSVINEFRFSKKKADFFEKIEVLRRLHKKRSITPRERVAMKEEIALLYCQMTAQEKILILYDFVKAKELFKVEPVNLRKFPPFEFS